MQAYTVKCMSVQPMCFCQELPLLWSSAQRILRYRPKLMSKQAEVLLNFRISTRGSIRQAPNVLTWCLVLRNLRPYGVSDPSTIINEYNSQVSRSAQLAGGKAHAVRTI